MDDTCAVQVVIHMLDFRLEINVSRFLGTYQIVGLFSVMLSEKMGRTESGSEEI